MRAPASYGVDLDRVGPSEPLLRRVQRRVTGRYPVDLFGGDPVLQDVVVPWAERCFSLEVDGGDRIPAIGPAALATHRRLGAGDPVVVQAAVRDLRRRRARVLGPADLPVLGAAARRLGALRPRGDDLAVALRAGYVVVVPLGTTLRAGRAGVASGQVLWGAIGFPVLPVVVMGGSGLPAGIPVGHHRVVVGEPLDVEGTPRDPLSAAELAEAARAGVQQLLDRSESRPRSRPRS